MTKRIALALCAVMFIASTPALAGDHGRGKQNQKDHEVFRQHPPQKNHDKLRIRQAKAKVIRHRGRHVRSSGKHHRRYRGHYVYLSPAAPLHRHAFRQGHHHHQDEARDFYRVLALWVAEALSESQRRSLTRAQQGAATAPIGDTIRWDDGGASGSVVATREGGDAQGRYCREFQQEVYIGRERQSGYGIACRQPDGAWEIVS